MMRAAATVGFFLSSSPPSSPLRRQARKLSSLPVTDGIPRRRRINGGEELYLFFPVAAILSGNPSRSGVCRASQAVELFSSVCPEIVVRDAQIEDSWEVAETHCSSFFPNYTFPLDLLLRINQFLRLFFGFSVPPGCKKTCLVAIAGRTIDDNHYIGSDDIKDGGFEGKFSFNQGYVAGILTIDTVADFLPRKGPLQKRRTGIAYLSNVAVRKTERRRGIAKRLISKAEVRARSWGCRSIALHCDAANTAATRLYKDQGYKCIRVPEHANWPRPKSSPDLQFNFMMKFLSRSTGP